MLLQPAPLGPLPLSICTALKQLDIRGCSAVSDLSPFASCRGLRRLYTSRADAFLVPLQGPMPRLEVKEGREEWLDARTL